MQSSCIVHDGGVLQTSALLFKDSQGRKKTSSGLWLGGADIRIVNFAPRFALVRTRCAGDSEGGFLTEFQDAIALNPHVLEVFMVEDRDSGKAGLTRNNIGHCRSNLKCASPRVALRLKSGYASQVGQYRFEKIRE